MTSEEQHDLLIRVDENVKFIKENCPLCSERLRNCENSILVLKTQAGVIGGFSGLITGFVLVVIQYFIKQYKP